MKEKDDMIKEVITTKDEMIKEMFKAGDIVDVKRDGRLKEMITTKDEMIKEMFKMVEKKDVEISRLRAFEVTSLTFRFFFLPELWTAEAVPGFFFLRGSLPSSGPMSYTATSVKPA